MIQPGIFEDLQKKIDDDGVFKDVCNTTGKNISRSIND